MSYCPGASRRQEAGLRNVYSPPELIEMGEMITKPDANPIVFALCNGFFGALGYFLMGQKKKAMISGIIGLAVVIPCLNVFVGLPWLVICMVDAYKLGQKLQAGESIGENENAIAFLDNIHKD